jgi:uncharacterized protein YgiM (DUF1202 family)
MSLQSLITFTPFLAVVYLLFAFMQALRKKRQGIGAIVLALVAVVVPLASLIAEQDTELRSQLVNHLTLNGIIVFVGSLIILFVERRNRARAANRSYGILGIALGAFIAVGIFVYPLLPATVTTSTTSSLTMTNANRTDNSTLLNVSESISSSQSNLTGATPVFQQNGSFPPPNGTPSASGQGAPPNPPSDQSASQVQAEATVEPTSVPATATEPVVRPTLIVFPTFEPTTESAVITVESTAEATSEPSTGAASDTQTCSITPIYNLNLRDQPNTDGQIFLSIPYGTAVTANGKTSDNWYSVNYNGQNGWVSGEYVSTVESCRQLPMVTG